MKYYSLKKIKEKNADYNLIIGERSNGKTYSCKKEICESAWKNKTDGMKQILKVSEGKNCLKI